MGFIKFFSKKKKMGKNKKKGFLLQNTHLANKLSINFFYNGFCWDIARRHLGRWSL